jgi:uncharacterized protein YprB with RNaseH-like and TPR domain
MQMLTSSFIFLDGIGRQRERTLWRRGIAHWDDFLGSTKIAGISSTRKGTLDAQLETARERLKRLDSSYFADHVPARDAWRCLGDFREGAVYLDIETTGISASSPITVVGMFDGKRMHTLVKNLNLTRSALAGILSSVKLIVTFNGSSFDLPMIESQFPGTVPNIPHVDLKHPLRRLGLTGGLKRIERELDIERDRRVEYMTGQDAVYLWRLWEREGKGNALELLKEYNTYDCRNLAALASYSYSGLRKQVFESSLPSGKG